ncbi:hypothetical protein BLOT_012767 [Blomia tropicalis]|nr:hypothetical protein BLOT_012767 [Blomia tropicalis]
MKCPNRQRDNSHRWQTTAEPSNGTRDGNPDSWIACVPIKLETINEAQPMVIRSNVPVPVSLGNDDRTMSNLEQRVPSGDGKRAKGSDQLTHLIYPIVNNLDGANYSVIARNESKHMFDSRSLSNGWTEALNNRSVVWWVIATDPL